MSSAPGDGFGTASVGLVHDYLLVMRGAERTFAEMAACEPEAPIYTLLYDEQGTEAQFVNRDVRPSPLQRLGVKQDGFRRLLPLLPLAAERLPVSEHDLVVSSSSAFAHGVRPREDAVHVCYCHTPFRYAWFEQRRALAEVPAALRPPLRQVLSMVRDWDQEATQRVTHYVANSELCRKRIEVVWGREASVVHPPVDVDRFEPDEKAREEYFLVVTELVAHKQVDVALEAARRAERPVKVVGSGPAMEELEGAYGETAEFLGRVDDGELEGLYQRAQALLLPNVEEFGITAVESQAAGRPVVAADAGGAQETVVDGETGVLVPFGDVDRLAEALRYVDFDRFDGDQITQHAEQFSAAGFRERFSAEVRQVAADPSEEVAASVGRPPAALDV